MDQPDATAEKGYEATLAAAGNVNFVWEVWIAGAELPGFEGSFVEAV